MGNSIEDYRATIGLFDTKKRCLYGLVNVRAESYQQIMLINLQCPALVRRRTFERNDNPKERKQVDIRAKETQPKRAKSEKPDGHLSERKIIQKSEI